MNRLLKDLEFKVYTTPLEKAGNSGERRLIRGYASVGDVLDRQNEVITLGALMKAKEDLLKNATIFYEHKHSELPIGKTIAVDIDEHGLLITVEMSKAPFVDSIWTLIQEGILNSFSIGGRVLEAEEKRDDKGNLFNEITKIELFETSVVGLPANPAAKFELISKSFGMAITEEMRKREVSNKMAKENKEQKVDSSNADSITLTQDTDSGTSNIKLEVTEKSEEAVEEKEEVKEETTEEVKEEVEKSEETEVEKSEETEVEKSEEVSEEKKEKIEKVLEEKSFHGDLPADKIQMVSEAVALISEASGVEASIIWEALSVIHVDTIDSEKSEEVESEEITEETSLNEDGSEKTEEEIELEEEKSIDEQILDTLAQILQEVTKKEEEVTEKTEEEEVEISSEETVTEEVCVKSEETTVEKTKEDKEDKSEEVKEEKSEETSEKVVKVEKEKEVEKTEEDIKRKGEVIIAETPYSNDKDRDKVDQATLKKLREKAWSKIIFGK